VVAKNFDRASNDQICTVLFEKTHFLKDFAQVTKLILSQITNKTLREILELSVSCKEEGLAKPGAKTLIEYLQNMDICGAADLLISSFEKCQNSHLTAQVFEDFHLFGFFDLAYVSEK
jgi:hypothetical protein